MSVSIRNVVLGGVCLAVPVALLAFPMRKAASSIAENVASASKVPVAAASDDAYCTPALKSIVRRVAGSCGLIPTGTGGRGCQPMEAKKVAALSDADFNALFLPLEKRAHLVQFDADKADLDAGAMTQIAKAWGDQRGASFFFVVSRASSDGTSAYNEALSQKRAEAVLNHLKATFNDPDLEKEVGLLWLGDSFAQLDDKFCSWQRSRDGECTVKDINRSAFIAWIDCAI